MDSSDFKVGCFIGDHTKTAINTIINIGAVIGVMSDLMNTGKLIPKFVPSFCWYLRGKVTKGYGLIHTIETAAQAMRWRNINLTPEEIQMLETVFDQTKQERRLWMGKSYRRSLWCSLLDA